MSGVASGVASGLASGVTSGLVSWTVSWLGPTLYKGVTPELLLMLVGCRLNYSSVSIGLEVNLVQCSKEFSSDMGVLVKQM